MNDLEERYVEITLQNHRCIWRIFQQKLSTVTSLTEALHKSSKLMKAIHSNKDEETMIMSLSNLPAQPLVMGVYVQRVKELVLN